jgi:CheY-like chemotaxis protein
MGRLGSNPRRLFFVSGHCEATGQHHRNELGATVSVPPIQLVRAVGCYRLSRQNHKASLNRNRGGVLRSAKMPEPAILSGITIVLVEDYADTLYGIAHFLRRHGAKVFPRPDAFQGLQAVREHRPDIVLSDIRLPERDGFQLLRDIRALGAENGGNVPVIAMTAFGGFAARDRTIAAGFEAHLDKPFSPDGLLGVIKSILRR